MSKGPFQSEDVLQGGVRKTIVVRPPYSEPVLGPYESWGLAAEMRDLLNNAFAFQEAAKESESNAKLRTIPVA